MKSGERVVIVSIFLVVALFLLTACSGSTQSLVGSWTPKNGTIAPYGYPDVMIFKADGTGKVDGMSMKWEINDDLLIIDTGSYLIGYNEYEYEISKKTLYLDGIPYIKS